MEPGDTIVDSQAEVRKLQDLVKKLEKQNEVLRTRQKLQIENALQNDENDHFRPANQKESVLSNDTPKKLLVHSNRKSEGDNEDIIDFEKVSLEEDEDSWLFTSPKPLTPSQSRVSPYKWARQAFDNPSPEVESVRRSLINKLDEAARLSRSSSTPTFNNLNAASPTKVQSRMSQSADNTPVQLPPRQIQRKGIHYGNNAINTGTFTRPKKVRDYPKEFDNDEERENMYNADSMDNKRQNVLDIENLAKQQEESLRQSLSQAHSSPRRGKKKRPEKNLSSAPAHVVDIDTESSGSSWYKYDSGNERRPSENNSIGSDLSSPPDSPHGSQYLYSNQESSSLRRSLPNVSRVPHNPGLYSSDPQLDNYSSGGSEDFERYPPEPRQVSRLQQPSPRPSSPGLSGLRPPATNARRGLSPQRSSLPTPARRSIPRPSSGGKSGIATPKRSNLPSPRSTTQVRTSDESWKEGCF